VDESPVISHLSFPSAEHKNSGLICRERRFVSTPSSTHGSSRPSRGGHRLIPGAMYPDEEIIVTAHLDHYKPARMTMPRKRRDPGNGTNAGELIKTRNSAAAPDDPVHVGPEYSGTYAWMSAHLTTGQRVATSTSTWSARTF